MALLDGFEVSVVHERVNKLSSLSMRSSDEQFSEDFEVCVLVHVCWSWQESHENGRVQNSIYSSGGVYAEGSGLRLRTIQPHPHDEATPQQRELCCGTDISQWD